MIACIFNFFGLLPVFFGELSLWFSRWIDRMNPASVVNPDPESLPHFPCVLRIERGCEGSMDPQPFWIRWSMNEHFSEMVEGDFEMPRFNTRFFCSFEPPLESFRQKLTIRLRTWRRLPFIEEFVCVVGNTFVSVTEFLRGFHFPF